LVGLVCERGVLEPAKTRYTIKESGALAVAPARASLEDKARAARLPSEGPEGGVRVRAWGSWPAVLALVFSDAVLAVLVWGLGLVLHGLWGRGEPTVVSLASILPNAAVWVGMRALLGLYPGFGLDAAEALRRQSYSVVATAATIALFALALQVGDMFSRLLLGLVFLILLVVGPLVRYLVKRTLKGLRLWGKPVAVLGAGEAGARLVRSLKDEWGLGFVPVAVFDFRLAPTGGVLEGVPYGGTVVDALEASRRHGVDTAVFAMPGVQREHLAKFVGRAGLAFKHVIVVPDLLGITNSAVAAKNLGGTFGVEMKHNLLDPWALRAKRALDLLATAVGGILILPLLVVLAVLVWAESRGGVFHRDYRMGRDGRLFCCLKFRTMVPDAEGELQRLLEGDAGLREEYLRYHKLRDDPRVTRVGRFLRKMSLDELPQLWNVLRGEMSLVGPRPYLPRESEEIGPSQEEVVRVPPGITGPWQVGGRSHASFEERVRMDAYYVRNWSVWLDLVLLARTIKALTLDRTAY
jgi:Undecaprenyl-phosphate galactose phosphotransferase WbaP